jgi:hypothetical protein
MRRTLVIEHMASRRSHVFDYKSSTHLRIDTTCHLDTHVSGSVADLPSQTRQDRNISITNASADTPPLNLSVIGKRCNSLLQGPSWQSSLLAECNLRESAHRCTRNVTTCQAVVTRLAIGRQGILQRRCCWFSGACGRLPRAYRHNLSQSTPPC